MLGVERGFRAVESGLIWLRMIIVIFIGKSKKRSGIEKDLQRLDFYR